MLVNVILVKRRWSDVRNLTPVKKEIVPMVQTLVTLIAKEKTHHNIKAHHLEMLYWS